MNPGTTPVVAPGDPNGSTVALSQMKRTPLIAPVVGSLLPAALVSGLTSRVVETAPGRHPGGVTTGIVSDTQRE